MIYLVYFIKNILLYLIKCGWWSYNYTTYLIVLIKVPIPLYKAIHLFEFELMVHLNTHAAIILYTVVHYRLFYLLQLISFCVCMCDLCFLGFAYIITYILHF